MPKNNSWLLLMHQLPSKPEAFRVRIWRNLQRIGALPLKNSVYVLPDQAQAKKEFEKIVEEIVLNKGDAFLCKSEFIQGIENEEIVEKFQLESASRYKALAEELRELQKITNFKKPTESQLMEIAHTQGKLERQLSEIKAIDFFQSVEAKTTETLLQSVLNAVSNLSTGKKNLLKKSKLGDFQGKTWVTRKNIYFDRVASAWLIETYIDKKAKFKFIEESDYTPKKQEIRFDMFNGEFTHVGDRCTFETLLEAFSIKDTGIKTIAQIVHDLDLKDTKFNRAETAGIGALLDGLIKGEKTDEARLKKSKAFFTDLHRSFSDS